MNPVALASGVLPEFGPFDIARAAVGAGFDLVGFHVIPEDWTDAQTRELGSYLSDNAMPVIDVEVLWLQPDSSIDDHRRILDVGMELGARNALCVASVPDDDQVTAWLQHLCEHVEGSAIRIALEFGIFTNVKSLGQALRILDGVDSAAKAMLIDPIHVDRSGASAADIAAVDRSLLPYAQFCDAPALRPDPDDFDAVIIDAIDLREQCGEGDLPLADIFQALPRDIPLSIELRSKALRDGYPDPVERAGAVLDATKKWLENNR